jgi:hypothetical protein
VSYSIQQPTDGTFTVFETSTGSTILQSDNDAKVFSHKIATVARTDTTAKNLFTIPANAIPIRISIYGGTASDAGTTGTVSVGKTGTNTYFVNAADVKGASGQIPCAAAAHLGAAVSTTASTQIVGIYAETGTASTTGGPWTIIMDYYQS